MDPSLRLCAVFARRAGRAEPAEDDLRLVHPDPGQIGLEARLLAPQAGDVDHGAAGAAYQVMVPSRRRLVQSPTGPGVGDDHEARPLECAQDMEDGRPRHRRIA
jgi:hypothetical protein